MLNNNKSTKKVNSVINSPSVNMISEGTKISGDIHTQKDIRISGEINGDIFSKGKIIITNLGKVTGNISALDADIAGRIEGVVTTKNKLFVRNSTQIKGDIYTKTLIVEEGAVIDGFCKMGEEKNTLTSVNDKKEPHLKASGS